MNQFYPLFNHPAILAAHPQRDFFNSDEFRARSELKGVDANVYRVRATLFMLQCCALHPRSSQNTVSELESGIVALEFFSVSNPILGFALPRGADLEKIRQAVQSNLASSMYRAAVATRKWQGLNYRRSRHEDAVQTRFRATLNWATPEDFKTDRVSAQAKQDAACALMHAHLNKVRTLRSARLAALSRAASPGVSNWTEYLANIAAHAFVQ
jgi:hypothetical protein